MGLLNQKSIAFGLALACAVPAAQAVTGGALTSAVFSCTNIMVTYAALTFDRDNTGSRAEAYTIRVADGAGNELFRFDNSFPVGTVTPGTTERALYTASPTMNPITLTFVSTAGNGFPQQQVWNVSGSCAGLPSAAAVPGLDVGGLAILATLLGAVGFGVRRRQRRRT